MITKYKTLFRVDFGSKVGLGHLKRSLVFAKEFEDVAFVSKSNQKEFLSYPLLYIKDEDEFFKIVKLAQPKIVVVDNYEFNYELEYHFKSLFLNIKLIVFDDVYKKHYCDEVINHNLNADIKRYKKLVPKFCKVRVIQPLIDDEFKKVAKKRQKKEGIFISFGGSDVKNLNLKVAKLLKDKRLYIYTTSSNKRLNELRRYANSKKNISLFVNKNVANGMHKAKFCLITSSTLSYEAIFLKKDFIAFVAAKNQLPLAKYLKQKRYKVIKSLKVLRREVGV